MMNIATLLYSSFITHHSSFLEGRRLVLEVVGADGCVAEEALERVGAGGGVAFVEVAAVGVDPAAALAGALDGRGPTFEVEVGRALLDVEAREVARAHPADVDEVG